MVRRKSNQRITKIKRDILEELIKKAEGTDINNAVTIHPAGDDLTPYPDMNYLRTWIRNYLLKGLTKTFVTDMQESGKTIMTTIVDGLVLNTSMTKSINVSGEPTIVEIPWTQPVMTTDGSLGSSEYGIAFSSEYTSDASVPYGPARNAFSDFSDTSKCWSPYGSLPEWITFYSPNKLKVTSVDFNFNAGGFTEIMPECNAYGSNDNSTWTPIGSFSGNSSPTITLTTNSSEAYHYHKYEFPQQALSYKGKVKILQHGVTLETGIEVKTAELPKPGLLLSNLCEPVSYSFSGGWLRQNLIHEDYSNINDITSSTLGHFAFSYLQQGIFHRDAGSTHEDFDSFNLHWSPSALGCMSHESIVIPNNLLQNVYSTYQSMVVPINADMQTYNFGATKDVQFTFVDNNNNIPLTTTTYNGRVVGKDWSYEFRVRPNFSGSGTNYGSQTRCCPDDDTTCISNLDCSGADSTCPECASDDTRSNGVIAEGNIITNDGCDVHYSLNVVSTQAILNANFNEHIQENINTLGSQYAVKTISVGDGTFIGRELYSPDCSGTSGCSHLNRAMTYFWDGPSGLNDTYRYVLKDSSLFGHSVYWLKSNGDSNVKRFSGSLSAAEANLAYIGDYYCQVWEPDSSNICQIVPNSQEAEFTAWSNRVPQYYYPEVEVYGGATSLTNVDIYLVIDDMKEQSEKLGLPWNGDCNSRFNVFITVSSAYESAPGRSFKVLYRGVNIDELGNISGLGLNTITVKG